MNPKKNKLIISIIAASLLFYLAIMIIVITGIVYISQISETGWLTFGSRFLPILYAYFDLIKSSVTHDDVVINRKTHTIAVKKLIIIAFKKFTILLILQTLLLFASKGELIDSIFERVFFAFIYLFIKLFSIFLSKMKLLLSRK